MTDKLKTALDNVQMNYQDLVEIADSILNGIVKPIDEVIDRLNNTVNSLSVDQLRDFILMIQLKAYSLSEIKEKAGFKADLADALQKEAFAVSFNGLDGSAAVKEKLALVATSAEVVTETLYKLIANMLKTKLDQLHRMVDALKSVLMSRMQENKFMNLGVDNTIPQTAGTAYVGPNGGNTKLFE